MKDGWEMRLFHDLFKHDSFFFSFVFFYGFEGLYLEEIIRWQHKPSVALATQNTTSKL
jgi:hypothetical protein